MADGTSPVQTQGRPRRTTLLAIAFVIVFVAGMMIGALALSVWVSPSLEVFGYSASDVSISSTCNGWPQLSFDGYFHCTVTATCAGEASGDYSLFNASSPQVSNLVVSPALPQLILCGDSATVNVAGQLGYSGSLTIYLQVE
jgi:hypothetical protein